MNKNVKARYLKAAKALMVADEVMVKFEMSIALIAYLKAARKKYKDAEREFIEAEKQFILDGGKP